MVHMAGPELEDLRRDLDEIDSGLVDLIARRLDTVAAVGKAKADTHAPVRDAERERTVLAGVEAAARRRGVSGDLVRRVFKEIIGHAVDRQSADLIATSAATVRVGFAGAEHSDSHLAALKHLAGRGEDAEFVAYAGYAAAVAAVGSGACDLAVLPIEDTTAGSINQVYDLLRRSDVAVVGEETWRIERCLAAPADIPVTALTDVLAQARDLEQCAGFLSSTTWTVTHA
jgi:chorismate mutase/prephenate dehydratase